MYAFIFEVQRRLQLHIMLIFFIVLYSIRACARVCTQIQQPCNANKSQRGGSTVCSVTRFALCTRSYAVGTLCNADFMMRASIVYCIMLLLVRWGVDVDVLYGYGVWSESVVHDWTELRGHTGRLGCTNHRFCRRCMLTWSTRRIQLACGAGACLASSFCDINPSMSSTYCVNIKLYIFL